LDWPEETKKRQEEWIGKSEGVIIKFKSQIANLKPFYFDVFTTRPDTLFGTTYLVLAPEKWQELDLKFALSQKINFEKIKGYLNQVKNRTYFERQFLKEKTGVFTGLYALNPANQKKIPVWIADYVLPNYGTGAIMAVPAHDQRDFEFAKKYGLPIEVVIKPRDKDIDPSTMTEAYVEEGVMVNSGPFTGMESREAMDAIAHYLEERGLGKKTVNRGKGHRQGSHQLPSARLGYLPAEILGCSHTHNQL